MDTIMVTQSSVTTGPSSSYQKTVTNNPDKNELTYSFLTNQAQEKFGKDVMISNVFWALKENNRVGATYDVLRCK